jgi:hypothetical protein
MATAPFDAKHEALDKGLLADRTFERKYIAAYRLGNLVQIAHDEAEKLRADGAAVTLEAWRARGMGPRFLRHSLRCVRYRKTDLEDLLASQLVTGTEEQL